MDLYPLTIDFESFFASKNKYSLKHMPATLYVRDPRFHVHGVGIKVGEQPTRWFTDDKIAPALETIDWGSSLLIGHNLNFDGKVLVEHYGHSPAAYADTLGIARAVMPQGVKHDLDSLAEMFNLGNKHKGVLAALNGVKNLSPLQLKQLGEYCKQDVELTYQIFKLLYKTLPDSEKVVLSRTVRMGVEAQLQLDKEVLERVLEDEKSKTRDTVKASGLTTSELSSNPQFAQWIQDQGLEPPLKQNKNGEMIPALGQTDPEYVRFQLDHPEHQHVYEARQRVKSRIGETRAAKFLAIANTKAGTMPMPYKYYGAHTGRPSGDETLNVTNLPRLDKSEIRRALVAPPGYVIVVVDSSQIELRTQLWFSGDRTTLDKLANNDDIYSEVASDIFKKPVNKKEFPTERGVGKAVELMGQYGAGPPRYRAYLAGGPYGLAPMFITDEESKNHIYTYRRNRQHTVEMWATLDEKLPLMAHKKYFEEFGPITFRHEGIELPNGMILNYHGLRSDGEGSWMYGVNGLAKFLWGGTMLENIIQALARIIVTDQAIRIEDELDVPVVGWTYDENLMLVPEKHADEVLEASIEIMRTPPDWAPDLPLDAEGGYDRSYSK